MGRNGGGNAVQPEQIAEDCIAVRLRILNRAVTRLYNQALRPHGLTISQMNILVALSCLGKVRQQEVCRVLDLEKSTLSRDVERMLDRGWLDTEPGPEGKGTLIYATSAGKKLLARATPAWRRAQQQTIATLGEEQAASLERAVEALRSQGQRG